MIKQKKDKALQFICLSFGLTFIQVVLEVLLEIPDPLTMLMDIFSVISWIIWIIGCAYFAQAKGYSSTMGGICGIFFIGLVVLLILKVKT